MSAAQDRNNGHQSVGEMREETHVQRSSNRSRTTDARPSGAERFYENPPKTMKAIFYDSYGGAEVLKFGELPTPRPNIRQIQIRVMATSVNPIDWRLRGGQMSHLLRGHFPRIPGYDVAGYVVDPGGDITLRRGDRVMAFLDSIYGGA